MDTVGFYFIICPQRLQEPKVIFLSRSQTDFCKAASPRSLVYRVSAVTLAANLLLTVCKLLAALLGKSDAMLADAVHSASDAFTTVLVIIGAHISSRQADETHPYGHERLECVVSLALSAILFAVGAGIGWEGVHSLLFADAESAAKPTSIALLAAVLSILAKELMYRYTMRAAKKANSLSLRADAWHHRSDALSSVGSLAGIGGAMLGFPGADSLAAAGIALLILGVAFNLCRDTLGRLVDHAAPKETERQIRDLVLSENGVLSVDLLRTRLFGPRIDVDLEISACGDLPLRESHAIAERVRSAVCEAFPAVKTCTVHVNPCG